MKHTLLTFLALAGISATTFGACPTRGACRNVAVKRVAVVKKVAVVDTVIVPVAVLVPVYSAWYSPYPSTVTATPGATPTPVPGAGGAGSGADVAASLKAIATSLQALDARLSVLEKAGGGTQPVPNPKPGDDPFNPKGGANSTPKASKAVVSCAGCHESRVAKEKGGGNIFWNGAVNVMTAKQKVASLRAIRAGTMPKGNVKLSEDDLADIADELLDSKDAKSPPAAAPVPAPSSGKTSLLPKRVRIIAKRE